MANRTVSTELYGALVEIVGDAGVLQDEPMSRWTTFGIGGPAECFVRPSSCDEVVAVVKACNEANVEWRVLGLGSDLLVSDNGIDGVTIQIADAMSSIEELGDAKLSVFAGASNKDVAEKALQLGLAGYEFASGIPGSIGGAAIMNAGAYGGEFSNVATELECITHEGEVVRVTANEANWSYRRSMMDDRGMVVLKATIQLHEDSREEIRARMDDLAARRSEKQPLEMPSAGSTFKRPEGHFAGKLIQDAGLQGYRVGGAEVSRKHAGFVVNAGGATSEDVVQLIHDVQKRILDENGILLEPEVRMWGFDAEEA